MPNRGEYLQLFELYSRVVDSTKGIPYTDREVWKGHAGPLAVKLAMHLATLFYLLDGTRLKKIGSFTFNFVDHSSINVIMRAALETFLTFHHLLVAPKTPQDREFRLRIWEVGGLRERQRFPVTLPESKAKLQQERLKIDDLITKIEGYAIFQTLTQEQRKRATKGEWRLTGQWSDLAIEAGMNRNYFNSLYRYLCSYAHSGSLSMLQIDQAEGRAIQLKLAETGIGTALIIMSRMVTGFAELFTEASACLKAAPEDLRSLVNIWGFESQVLDDIYDRET